MFPIYVLHISLCMHYVCIYLCGAFVGLCMYTFNIKYMPPKLKVNNTHLGLYILKICPKVLVNDGNIYRRTKLYLKISKIIYSSSLRSD